MTELKPETIWHVADGLRGIYTRSHALQILREDWKTGLSKLQEVICLRHPQSEQGQELLEKFVQEASFLDDNGFVWTLHEDQDIFAVREDHEWEDLSEPEVDFPDTSPNDEYYQKYGLGPYDFSEIGEEF